MNFPDTADKKKKEDVKEAGELKPETVCKDNGTDETKPESVKDPGEQKGDTVNNADGTGGTTEKTGNVKSDNKQNTEGADKTSTDVHIG